MLKLKRLEHILFCGILAALPLERLPSLDVAGSTVRISQVLGVLLIVVAVPRLWSNKSDWFKAPWLFLALFNGASFISAAASQNPRHSLKVACFIAFVSLLAYVISLVFDPKKWKQYLVFGAVGVVGSCLFGLYQFIGDLAGLPSWLTGLRPEYAKGGIFSFPRIQSTALEPLYFSNYLLVPLAIAAVCQAFLNSRKAGLITFLTLLTITLGLSRGAQVAASFIVLTVIGVAAWKRRIRPALGVAATAIASIGVGLLLIGFASLLYDSTGGKEHTAAGNVKAFTKQASNLDQGESAEGRALTRRLAFNAASENPWLGLGPGNFGAYAVEKRPDKFTSPRTIVNNEPLELSAENGLIGLAAMLLFAAFALRKSLRAALTHKKAAAAPILWAVMLGLAAIAMQYQLFSTLYITHIWVATGLLLGLARTTRAQA